MKFTKMHGIGNDYVYVNGFAEQVADPTSVAVRVSDRHFGIGSDGLILILPSEVADVRMRMFNADGSEGEMCGNGIRCVAKYAWDHGLSRSNPMKVETGRGVLTLSLNVGADGRVSTVAVDMGEPILELEKIPVDDTRVRKVNHTEWEVHPVGAWAGGTAVFVSMGNPHAVIFVDNVAAVELEKVGPALERHPAFPRRMNVHFAQVVSDREVIMRTWERGSGITWACGTGACAVTVAAALTGRTGRKVLAHLPGGDLELEWKGNGSVEMTGPATEVFSGEWPG
jgi:diaminopimelate epimerase